jgi:integrase
VPLTELQIKNAKPQPGKSIRLFDARGLYLEVSEAGRRWWRLKYRYAGKEKRLSLGVYPETSLKEARERCGEARKLLGDGVDPSIQRKVDKLASAALLEDTFEKIGREWYGKQAEVWVPEHAARILSRLERDIFPFLGGRPITAIEAPELLGVLRRIESRGVRETVRRARQDCDQIFAFAIAAGLCKLNPAAGLSRALAPKKKAVHFPSITEPRKFGELLRTMDGYQGSFTVRCALRLAPLFAVRPGELRKAKWADFDLRNAEWRFVASKTHPDHIVPLSRQALAILRELHQLTGTGQYVFPGARSTKRPMSDNAVLAALRTIGIPADVMTGHGFRASFRTIGDEVLKFRVDLLEHQIAHEVKDPNGRAYNRTAFLVERKRMMQRWSDYLDRLKSRTNEEEEIVEIPKRA